MVFTTVGVNHIGSATRREERAEQSQPCTVAGFAASLLPEPSVGTEDKSIDTRLSLGLSRSYEPRLTGHPITPNPGGSLVPCGPDDAHAMSSNVRLGNPKKKPLSSSPGGISPLQVVPHSGPGLDLTALTLDSTPTGQDSIRSSRRWQAPPSHRRPK